MHQKWKEISPNEKDLFMQYFHFIKWKRCPSDKKVFYDAFVIRKGDEKDSFLEEKLFSSEKDFDCFENLQKKWKGKENYFDLPSYSAQKY